MINQNDLPLVSIESMNETHFEEIEIINLLLEQINSKEEHEKLSSTLENLLQHMDQHFSSEEELMKESHYPSLNMHKADHGKVINQARYAEMQWRNKKDIEALNEYLQEERLCKACEVTMILSK